MITFDIVKSGENPRIKELWKKEAVALGIPWGDNIEKKIASGRFHCIRDDGVIVGFCGSHILKRKKIARIEDFMIDEPYRGRGYSKVLMRRCYEDLKPFIDSGFSFQVEAKEGCLSGVAV